MAASDALEPVLRNLLKHPNDPDVWEELYRLLWPWVLGKIQAQLRGDVGQAEDLSQEVMLRILRTAHFGTEFEDARIFRAYVSRICQNLVIDAMRKRIHERVSNVLPDQLPEHKAALGLTQLLAFSEARSQLSEEDARLLDLLLEGFSSAEIAQKLNLSVGTTYNKLTGLRKHLRELMGYSEQKS